MKNVKRFIVLIMVALIAVSSFVLLAACKGEPNYPDRRLVEKDTVFNIDLNRSTLRGMPMTDVVFDAAESHITLRKDGTATIRLLSRTGIAAILNSGMLGETAFNEAEIDAFIEMIYAYLPGADFTNLSTVQKAFQATLGLTILGLDDGNEEVQNLLTQIVTTKTLPEQINLPSDFRIGLEVTGNYYIKDVYSEHTDTTHTGVFMGNHHEDGEAFLLMTLTKDTEAKTQSLNVLYRAMSIDLNATHKEG